MEAKRSDRVVIHELLAFVQQKLDVMDELSLEQICTTSYTEEDILAAKKVLADTAVTTIRLGTRQRDGRGKKDLQDIFRVLKQTDPDDVPTFVARDLFKLPPVTFDHIDVTTLLKDITLLKVEVSELRSKFIVSEQTVAVLKNEVTELRKGKIAASTISPSSAQNITCRRGGNACVSKSTTSTPRQSDLDSTQVDSRPEKVVIQPVAVSSRQKSYAQVSRDATRLPRGPLPHTSEVDMDGFILVEKKKRRPQRTRNHRGTAPPAVTMSSLRAAEPRVAIYLSRFDQSTSGTDVVKYIGERCGGQIQELNQFSLSRLESTRATSFKSYVLRFPVKYKETLLAPEFWPEGIVFRRFREAKLKKNP